MTEVTCAIIIDRDKILATRRGPGMRLPGKWEFPGGKIEVGESAEECILREIREELHLEILIHKRLPGVSHDYGEYRIHLIPFVAGIVSGELRLKEHMAYAWLSPDELMQYDWASADLPVVSEVKNMLTSGG